MISAMLAGVRRTSQSLLRSPTVTVSAILCLALGLGATAAISSAVYRALLRPLPFPEPERLVALHRVTPNSGPQGTWPQSVENYLDIARQMNGVRDIAASAQGTTLAQLSDGATTVSRRLVTGGFFQMLGATPFRGRLVVDEDDKLESPNVAVISHEFWSAKLGSDPSALGRTLNIGGEPTTIVGILKPEFRVPHGFSLLEADLWMPIRFTPEQRGSRRSNYLQILGRLGPNVSLQTADVEMRTVFDALIQQHPELRGESMRVAALQSDSSMAVRTPLLLLFSAVVMVLLIAATNVAALLLARGVQRRKEMAVRTALGASAWSVMRPVLQESVAIAVAGVGLGLGLALVAVKSIGTLAAARIPQLAGLTVDYRIVAFTTVLALVVAVLCGAVPAWRAASVDPQDALRSGRGGGGGKDQQRALRGLIIAEVSLSVVLLIGSGLVLKGFAGLLDRDPGFEPDKIVTVRVTIDPSRYPDGSSVPRFLVPALDAIGQIPGVAAAGALTMVPYSNWGNNFNVTYEGRPSDDPTKLPLVEIRRVSPGFFQVTQQRLLSGRLLTTSDDSPQAPEVVVVNEALVKRDFPTEDPLGKRFNTGDTTFATIVGVVSDIRNVGPFADPQAEVYFTYAVNGGAGVYPLMIRVKDGDPLAVVSAVRSAVQQLDPMVAIGAFRPMRAIISSSLGQPRFYLILLATFAGVALVLTLAGLYGILSYAVAQRTREMGIRLALGSPRAALVTLITSEGLLLVSFGLVIGAIASYNVRKWMAFMLYGVSPVDVVTWLACIILMTGAALVAMLIPAWRASKVNPIIAIHAE